MNYRYQLLTAVEGTRIHHAGLIQVPCGPLQSLVVFIDTVSIIFIRIRVSFKVILGLVLGLVPFSDLVL